MASESSPWRQNNRHDVNTRHDDKMALLQKICQKVM